MTLRKNSHKVSRFCRAKEKRMTGPKSLPQVSRLSALQRWILAAALAKLTPSAALIEARRKQQEMQSVAMAMLGMRVAAPDPSETSEELFRLYLAEIKARYYRFPVPDWVTRNDGGDIGRAIIRSGLRGQFFNPSKCHNYRAATTAISRAITRLERRGLVNVLQGASSHWTAVTLTDIGKEIATRHRDTLPV